MKVETGVICRGDGLTYVEARVRKAAAEHTLRVTSVSEAGAQLPVAVCPRFTDAKPGTEERLVLVTPHFSTSTVVFKFEELDGEAVVASAQKSLSRESIKWASRLNYRLRSEEAQAIRDIEKNPNPEIITIKPFLVHEINGVFTYKGWAELPLAVDVPEFTLMDPSGNKVPELNLVVGEKRPAVRNGISYWELSFTLRVGRHDNCCLVVSSPACNQPGLLYLDETTKGGLLTTNEAHLFYQVAAPHNYPQFVREQSQLPQAQPPASGANVCFSIVVPLYKTPIPFFEEMCASVFNQTYSNWELVLVNASPEDQELSAAVAALTDVRVKVVALQQNLSIAENTNAGIEVATGDFICFFDHDDLLEPGVLAEYANALESAPETDAFYCDEDLFNENGEYLNPHFKSDLNIDLLRCHNYVTHFLAVRAGIAKRLMLNPAYDGAQDYDFILRVTEETQNIHHIARVLYHWRMHSGSTAANPESKRYADEAGRKALEDHLKRCSLPAEVTLTENPFVYHVRYELTAQPLVSIIIPNKDNAPVLHRCIDSLLNKTTYQNFEVIVVENNSTEDETFAYYEELANEPKVRVVTWEHGFNYSAINNFGETFATGEYLLLLNNDTEVIEPEWLTSMLSYCQREDVGIAGARLLYPDNTVQHAGVFMMKCQNVYDLAGPTHVFLSLDKDDAGYMNRAVRPQDLSCVTAACLLVKRSVYKQVGGLDEDFVVAYNDVDFCLRVRELGLNIVYVPDAVLYHYESLSRGGDDEKTGVENYARFISEQGRLRARWARYYAAGDPYHSKYATMKLEGWK